MNPIQIEILQKQFQPNKWIKVKIVERIPNPVIPGTIGDVGGVYPNIDFPWRSINIVELIVNPDDSTQYILTYTNPPNVGDSITSPTRHCLHLSNLKELPTNFYVAEIENMDIELKLYIDLAK